MKDALRLLVYLAATILLGALLAPVIFWAAQSAPVRGLVPSLADVDFERFFRRALLFGAVVLLWPLLRAVRVRNMRDLELDPNPHWKRALMGGFLLAAIPLFCGGAGLIACRVYALQPATDLIPFAKLILTTAAVPLIEETFFRGLILGVLLRTGHKYMSIFLTSVLYSLVHFLKAPEQTSTIVAWTSGFSSIAHAFAQFSDLMPVAAGFATLFLIGWILADARMRTRSLWLPIGLHAGWIFASGAFNRIAELQVVVLPWLGRNLLVGIIPLGLGCLTWLIMRGWLSYYGNAKT